MESYIRLEQEFSKWAGVDNTVACNSGTAALHIALQSLALPPGSTVICPDFTMVACARAIIMAGLVPKFVDCDDNLNMDIELLGAAIDGWSNNSAGRGNVNYGNELVSAVLAVHIYGRALDMPSIIDLAKKHDIMVIEDLAEIHGIHPHPNTDAACWSFYKNKVIAGEEGGIVAFPQRKAAAAAARRMRTLGFDNAHDFNHCPGGHNYRLANCLADKVLVSLGQVQENIVKRVIAESRYDEYCPTEWRMPKRDIPWVYDIRIPGMVSADQQSIISQLHGKGIAARHAFKPMSHQEEFKRCDLLTETSRHKALTASREVIYLPLTPEQVDSRVAAEAFDIIRQTVS